MSWTDERIERLGHDKLSTFGIGTAHGRDAWRSIIRQLVAHGLIDVDVAGHGGLSISAKGREFLRENPEIAHEIENKIREALGISLLPSAEGSQPEA